MAPALALALPARIDLVLKLGGLFASGSETSQRNVKAAEIVVAAAKEAIGAVNEQQLAEVVQNDPDAAKAVREAIDAKFLAPDAKGFWQSPVFWLTVMLLGVPYLLLVDMLFVHADKYEDTLRTQVVTAVLTVVALIGAYWMGTSASSQRKTDLLSK